MAIKPEYTYRAALDRVVDGDTYDMVIDLGFGVAFRTRIRLRGADTPELHNVKHGSKEHEAGVVAAEAVEGWFYHSEETFIRTHKEKGKFGRWLADIENERGESLYERLITTGFARATDEDGNDLERRDTSA